MDKIKLEWEPIDQEHAGTMFRARVPGGWLVKEVQDKALAYPEEFKENVNGWRYETGYEWRSSVTFVPDAEHEWGRQYAAFSWKQAAFMAFAILAFYLIGC